MKRHNPKELLWDKCQFTDSNDVEHDCYFTDLRVDKTLLEKAGYHVYEIRHDDDGNGDWVELSDFILVNFWGTMVVDHEIEMIKEDNHKPYAIIKDYNYCCGGTFSFKNKKFKEIN